MFNKSKHLIWALALFALAACGGGGGGSSSGGGGGGGGGGTGAPGDVISLGAGVPLAGDYLEAIDGRAGAIDPFSLRPGSTVRMVAVRYSSTGARTVLASNGWGLTGANNTQVTLGSDGLVTGLAVTPTPFTVFCTVNGVTKTQQMKISNDTTLLKGVIRRESSTTGIKYIEVEAVNAAGQVVAGAITGDGGNFTMRIPAGVAGFSIDKNSVNTTTYYRQIRYNLRDYAADAEVCPVTLTGLTAGTNTLPHPVYLLSKTAGPPPPPPNCF